MLETVRDNPIPSIIAGLSIGWLVSAGNRSKSSPRTGPSGYYDHERGAGSRPAAGQDSDTWPAAGERAREAADEVQKTTEQYRQQMQQSVQQTAGEAQRRTQETIGDVRQSTRRTVGRVEQAVENNPLAAGVATLALGAFAGLMFPSTRQEDELVGDTRDRMVHQAQETARETADRARHVAEKTAEEAKRTAKEEVQQQQEEMSQKS